MEKQVLLLGHVFVQVKAKAQFSVFHPAQRVLPVRCRVLLCLVAIPPAHVGGRGAYGDTNRSFPILPRAPLVSKWWSRSFPLDW